MAQHMRRICKLRPSLERVPINSMSNAWPASALERITDSSQTSRQVRKVPQPDRRNRRRREHVVAKPHLRPYGLRITMCAAVALVLEFSRSQRRLLPSARTSDSSGPRMACNIAYAVSGEGPPLVMSATCLTRARTHASFKRNRTRAQSVRDSWRKTCVHQ
jgi:hypothetical protein